MIKHFIFLTFLIGLRMPAAAADPAWQRAFALLDAGRGTTSLSAHPLREESLLAASGHQVLETLPQGSWRLLWQTSGPQKIIHRLKTFPQTPHSLFALTNDGVFHGDLKTGRWQALYRRSLENRGPVRDFTIVPGDPNHWLLAVGDRLLESDNRGKTWFFFDALPENSDYSLIRFINQTFFVAAGRKLYRSQDLVTFLPVFTLSRTVPETGEEDPEESPGEEPLLTALTASGPRFWLATRDGVFESRDSGRNWAALPTSGLTDPRVRYLVYAQKFQALFIATPSGVYRYLEQSSRWQALYQGLSDLKAQDLLLDPKNEAWLFTVTRDGILKFPLAPEALPETKNAFTSVHRLRLLRRLARLEMSAREIQEAVIRYANLGNGKIKRWHTESRLRALMPNLSFGKDFSRSNNIDIDRGSTSKQDVYIGGPDDISRGWDFDVSWSLEDFIWGSAQTSIDSRQKLMVDQRHDLLSEATRLYYERRRMQMALLFSPASGTREHLEQLIRIDELGALLDAMTGGAFGTHQNRIYRNHPELLDLWAYEAPGISETAFAVQAQLAAGGVDVAAGGLTHDYAHPPAN